MTLLDITAIEMEKQTGTDIIPIEAKGGKDKSATSFKKYIKEHCPKNAVRFSQIGYQKPENFTNIPLYLANKLPDLLN